MCETKATTTAEGGMPSERFQRAKAAAMAGYLDPGPGHLNCAQTVARCGLLAMEQDPELTAACNYLGGGMVRMGQLCGALSGAAVALGFRDLLAEKPEDDQPGYAFSWLQKLTQRFEAEFGSATCRGLLGCDISTAEGFRNAKRLRATRRCPDFVSWTCDQLAEILDRAGAGEKAS